MRLWAMTTFYAGILLLAIMAFVPPTNAADFSPAHAATALHEAGFVDHPDDRGGRTYFGIAENYWPSWEGWALIDAELAENGKLTPTFNRSMASRVEQFYRVNFWGPVRGDQFPDQEIASQLYDIAVNQGTRTSGCYLQRALNALNRAGRDFPDLVVDCRIGPATLAAMNSFLDKRKATALRIGDQVVTVGAKWILMAGIAHQKHRRWADLAMNSQSQQSFLNGWTVRALQEIVDVLHSAGALK